MRLRFEGENFQAGGEKGEIGYAQIYCDTPVTDTCTYTSGDWNIDIADNCVISTQEDLGTNKLVIEGTAGTLTVTGSIRAKEVHLEPDDFNGDYIVNMKNIYIEG